MLDTLFVATSRVPFWRFTYLIYGEQEYSGIYSEKKLTTNTIMQILQHLVKQEEIYQGNKKKEEIVKDKK